MTSCFVHRRLAQTDSAYDVDVFFDSTTIDETALTSAKDALEQSGVAVEYVEEVDGETTAGMLVESRLKELMPPMPIILFKAVS